MLAMSGAYMAISIQETAAANALAFTLGGLGGKRKRKKIRAGREGKHGPLYKLECQLLLCEDYEA